MAKVDFLTVKKSNGGDNSSRQKNKNGGGGRRGRWKNKNRAETTKQNQEKTHGHGGRFFSFVELIKDTHKHTRIHTMVIECVGKESGLFAV